MLRRKTDWDLIFVLAGGEERKVLGLELFRDGQAPRMILSTSRFEIRKFVDLPLPLCVDLGRTAFALPPRLRYFFVAFEEDSASIERIPHGRFGTWSEIVALAVWLRARPQVRSLLFVSSQLHLRRVAACSRALLPADLRVEFLPASENAPGAATRLREKLKTALYRILAWFPGLNTPSGAKSAGLRRSARSASSHGRPAAANRA